MFVFFLFNLVKKYQYSIIKMEMSDLSSLQAQELAVVMKNYQ